MFKSIKVLFSFEFLILLMYQLAVINPFFTGMFLALSSPKFSYCPGEYSEVVAQMAGLISLLLPLYLFITNPVLREEFISFYFSSLAMFLKLTALGLFLCIVGIRCFLALILLLPLRSDLLALIETAIFVIQLATVGISVVLLSLYSSYRVVRYYV